MNIKKHNIFYYYIILASIVIFPLFTMQTTVVLGIEPHINQFLIPCLLTAVFGTLLARFRIANDRLEEISGTDPLTGLYNRRWLEKNISICLDNYKRYGIKFSVLILDIDNFKTINDRYGHQKGDKILVNIANILKSTSRTSDYCARWGGEEFIVILPNTDINGAITKAEKLRSEIESTHEMPAHITCSFGVAGQDENDESCDGIIKRADSALYNAKDMGKNRVECLVAA